MQRKSILWTVLFALTLGLIFLTPKLATSQQTQIAQGMSGGGMCGQGMMGGGMMGGGMMGGGMMGGDMGIIHQMFANHNQIRRTVEEIPGGIRSTTESDSPEIAALIQQHVPTMYKRLDEGRELSMISPTLPVMFRNANRYQRKLEKTPKGVTVTETSQAPDMVAVIREHAHEVDGFVSQGMSAMCGGISK
ncbi:MAG: hypothetical protein MUC60_00360 [Oscillatoria sp. Prado101]|nr:hypothetical protein [Oscillatoria sp. Prado101]